MGKEYEREITVLGSVAPLGPVVLYDDMESLLKWVESGTGGDTVFEKISTVAYNGTASLHMKTRTTTATAADDISGGRLTFQRPGMRGRMEFLFMADAEAQCASVYCQVVVYDGTYQHIAAMSYDQVNHKWQYRNSAAAFADVVGGGQNLQVDQFHRFLVEWDENSGKYIRFVCDGLEMDISSLSFYKTASAAAQSCRVDVGMTAGATPPGEIYFDDVLVMEI